MTHDNFHRRLHSRCAWSSYAIALLLLSIGTATCVIAVRVSWAADSQNSAPDAASDHEDTPSQVAELTLSLQSRDHDGKPVIRPETINPRKVGVVVVDPWNFHWCKTATMRVDALIPRINRSLDACRELGMTIMLCPSDVVDNYVGWPQREIVLAMPKRPAPPLRKLECPPPPDGGGCACGHDRCKVNFGWDAMHPDLKIGAAELMPDALEEVWTICQDRQLTHLLYMGVHTQVCLLGKPMGLRNLTAAGMKCILARDLTDAHPGYAPERGFTPDGHTAEVVAHFERYLAPTIMMSDELAKIGKWDNSVIVDPVRITPWGTEMRPHLFSDEVTVTLSAPWEPTAELRYTTDGTQPTSKSTKYERPLKINETTKIRVAGFVDDQRVCFDSEGVFCKLPPMPPEPDVPLSGVQLLRFAGNAHSHGGKVRSAAHTSPPQINKSNEGKPLRLRDAAYAKGYGVHAPNQLMFALKPEYSRFVALAGVDENLLDVGLGTNAARHPSVVFKVFIDGHLAASSPVMRFGSPPWRFDVKIPPGSQVVTLATTDAGNGNKEDLANWVNCGFVKTPN